MEKLTGRNKPTMFGKFTKAEENLKQATNVPKQEKEHMGAVWQQCAAISLPFRTTN
uniref:Uncharacterized protein n=1 Tax=Rhizophora mucronata TaxID=61149 RepID=A0A2P2QQ81_RHIMU